MAECVDNDLQVFLIRTISELLWKICCNSDYTSFTIGEYTKCNFDHTC